MTDCSVYGQLGAFLASETFPPSSLFLGLGSLLVHAHTPRLYDPELAVEQLGTEHSCEIGDQGHNC